VSFNVYREELSGEEWRQFHALGKPALIGEFQFGSTDTGLFWPGLFDVAAEDQRGPAYGTYLRSALANPDIVGCHWFQPAFPGWYRILRRNGSDYRIGYNMLRGIGRGSYGGPGG
jgi:hypothetical protein